MADISIDNKEASQHNVELRALDNELHELEFERGAPAKHGATAYDIRDMDALGLLPTFRRRFKFIAMIGFSSTVVVAWQNTTTTFGLALFNGGTGGLFWTYIFSMVAMCFVYLTLGELASIFPTAGGQYQWVAECAPPSMRKPLAYCVGWLLVLGWQTWLTSCGVVIGNTIKYCILVYHPDSVSVNTQWFPTLLAMVALVSGGMFNIYMTRKFPLFESIMLIIHFAGWLAIVVVLWVTSPRGNAHEVLFTFTNGGGWSSPAVATLVGVITAWSSLLGYDSAVHMTENVQDASRTIPYSLMVSYVGNAALAFIAAVTLIFCAGNIQDDLANPNLLPFIVIFHNSTKSKAATILMTLPLQLTGYSAMISQTATASRQLWSFARDGGIPFAHLLAPVSLSPLIASPRVSSTDQRDRPQVHDAEVPHRAVWATVAFTCALSCINFGPVVGFYAIVSLAVVSVTCSYTICTATLIWRRLRGRPLPQERFTLGKWGLWINIVTLCCTAPVTVLSV